MAGNSQDIAKQLEGDQDSNGESSYRSPLPGPAFDPATIDPGRDAFITGKNKTLKIVDVEARFEYIHQQTEKRFQRDKKDIDDRFDRLTDKIDHLIAIFGGQKATATVDKGKQRAQIDAVVNDDDSDDGGVKPFKQTSTALKQIPSVYDGPKAHRPDRDEGGNINFAAVFDTSDPSTMTTAEQRVHAVWPELITKHHASTLGESSERNKCTFASTLKLDVADDTVFDKLGQIQQQLCASLVPYRTWASRVAMDLLSGDFKGLQLMV